MKVPLGWIKEFVPLRLRPDRLSSMLTMSGLEVENAIRTDDDLVFDLGVTPNRSDCLSVMGIAREVAAITRQKFKEPAKKAPEGRGRISDFVKISVRHRSRCPRYTARIIDGVKIGPSPAWIAKRLEACGLRSINNVVDAANYVMIETGQPLHAFDLKFISGGRVEIRTAGGKMNFKTLDGVERKLVSEDLLICDGKAPIALAGVMGGGNSEVREGTTSLLLESAYFEPRGIRKTSRRLGLASESSRRFERGVDPNGTLDALHRLTKIILETSGGTATSDWVDIYPQRIRPLRLSISAEETNRILGTDLGLADIGKILKRIGLGVSRTTKKGGSLAVTVPTSRPDLEREIDLIEEVARLHGYGEICETMPHVLMAPIVRPAYSAEEESVRDALVGIGLIETVIYGFTSEESLAPFAGYGGVHIKVDNPLSQDEAVMRTTLIPGLLGIARLNANRQHGDCRLFAMQNAYERPRKNADIRERKLVAGLLVGQRDPRAWQSARELVDFYDAKGAVEAVLSELGISADVVFGHHDAYGFMHPGNFAGIESRDGTRLGFVGQLHPDVASKWDLGSAFVFEMEFENVAKLSHSSRKRYKEYSKYPHVERDFALLVKDSVPAADIRRVIVDGGDSAISDVRIFDVYRGSGIADGNKSVAVTVQFARSDGTLTDEEVGAAEQRILGVLKSRLGAVLRT